MEDNNKEEVSKDKIRWKPLLVPTIVAILGVALIVVGVMIVKNNLKKTKNIRVRRQGRNRRVQLRRGFAESDPFL